MVRATEAGIDYIFDHIGKNPAQVSMGSGLLPAISGNFTPRDLLRDPKRGCGSESPFKPGLGYHSSRGYQYDVPRISESNSNKASLGGFLKETALGGLMGGLAGAAFYKLDKGIERLKESVRSRRNTRGIGGVRNNRSKMLIDEEIAGLLNDIDALGADPPIFRFNEERQTGFVDKTGTINIRGDVLSDLNSNHSRDRMSPREVVGMMNLEPVIMHH